MVRREIEESMNQEIPKRYHNSKDRDVNERKEQSRHHSVGSHYGNENLKFKMMFILEGIRRERHGNSLQGELKKLKPPTFDGEKYGEVAKIWLLEMNKYLQLHDYFDKQKTKIYIYNLHGKAYPWWKMLVHVEGLDEREIYGE